MCLKPERSSDVLSAEIVCIGKPRSDFCSEGCDEYIKRLSPYMRLEICELAEARLRGDSAAFVGRAVEEEGERILKRLERQKGLVAAMCVEGKSLSSEQFAELISEASMKSGSLSFVIGGSWGLSDAVKARADVRLSMSAMTLPHRLARLVLCEQIYRAATINAGKTYHK